MLATGREPCNAHDRGHAAPALRLSLSMPSCGPLRSIAPGRYGPRQRHPARSGQSANRVREQALWADSGHSTPATMRRMSNERAKSTISVPALEGRRKSTAGKRKKRTIAAGSATGAHRPRAGVPSVQTDLRRPTQSGPCGQARCVLSETAHSQPTPGSLTAPAPPRFRAFATSAQSHRARV